MVVRAVVTYDKEFVPIGFVDRRLKVGIPLHVLDVSGDSSTGAFDRDFSLLDRLQVDRTAFTQAPEHDLRTHRRHIKRRHTDAHLDLVRFHRR